MRIMAILAVCCAIGSAHVVVKPAESQAGKVEKYTLRMPNEKQVATVRVTLTIPADVEVSNVDETAGWKVMIVKNASGRITSLTWAGTLAVGKAVEFTFNARNPGKAGVVEWKAAQVYADGLEVEWTGAEGTKTPASRTKIVVEAPDPGKQTEHQHP